MDIGLLWKIDHPRHTLAQAVARAAEAYRRRFGEVPTVCFIHPVRAPRLAPGEQMFVAGLRLLTARSVPPGFIWLAVNAAAELRLGPAEMEVAV